MFRVTVIMLLFNVVCLSLYGGAGGVVCGGVAGAGGLLLPRPRLLRRGEPPDGHLPPPHLPLQEEQQGHTPSILHTEYG